MNMPSWQDALDTLLGHVSAQPATMIPVEQADGRILASDALAALPNPAFDNSAMDGFAVRTADLAGASDADPIALAYLGEIAAGDAPDAVLPGGANCLAIMTGAPMPKGADSVVPVENITREGDKILFTAAPNLAAHIRPKGSDFAEDQVLAQQGQRLDPLTILTLAGAGIASVSVYQQPVVGFVSTGKEIIDDLSAELAPGQIYNSSRPGSVAQLKRFGADVISYPSVGDDPAALAQAIADMRARGCRLILSTGAVSMGNHDFVADVLNGLGATILFHKLRLRPGKPNLCAVLPDGTIYLGLPGNPVSTACGLRFFAKPVLDKMQGLAAEEPVRAVLDKGSFKKRPGFRHMLKGRARIAETGQVMVDILDGQMSYQVAPLAQQNCWIALPEELDQTEAGQYVDIWPVNAALFEGKLD